MKLRAYQQLAVQNAIEKLDTHGSTLLILPTGTGKTVCFAALADHYYKTLHKRIIVTAHRTELIEQAAAKIQAVTGIVPDIDMGDRIADAGMWKSPIVVASIQTLISKRNGVLRLNKFDASEFAGIIIDEAHHATSPSYIKVIKHFAQHAFVCGVTATPDRLDEVALGNVFKSVAYNYHISNAIRDGWLVPVRHESVFIRGLDYSKVKESMGDLSQSDIAKAQSSEEILQQMIAPMMEIIGNKRTIVFAAAGFNRSGDDPFHIAERVTEIIDRYKPGVVARVSQKTPKEERKETLARFASGDIQIVVNVGVLTEGFDDPGIECVAVMRPTKSRALYAQMLGRGTRPLPGLVDQHSEPEDRIQAILSSKKPSVLCIDFEGRNGKHKLVHAADVLAGKGLLPHVVAKAQEKLRKNGGDVLEAIEAVKREEEEEKKRKEARRHIVAKPEYKTLVTDPFSLIGVPPMDNSPPWAKEMSDKQRIYLIRNGFPVEKIKSSRQASAVIAKLKEREERGLPSYRAVASGATKRAAEKIANVMGSKA